MHMNERASVFQDMSDEVAVLSVLLDAAVLVVFASRMKLTTIGDESVGG